MLKTMAAEVAHGLTDLSISSGGIQGLFEREATETNHLGCSRF